MRVIEEVYQKKKIETDYQQEFMKWASNTFLNTSCVDFANIAWFVRCTARALKEATNDEKSIVIGLCGNAGTGKDSATEFLLHYPRSLRCTRFALADPIREIGKIFGFTMEQMTDRTLKEAMDDFWKVSPRYFMQRVGTEMFRKQWRDDVWIELAHRRILDLSLPYEYEVGFPKGLIGCRRIIFISDIRFPNEAEFVKKIGGYVVKIQRDGFSKTGENLHDSEKFIASIPQDVLIRNDCKNAHEWTWKFTTELMRFLTNKSFYSGFDDRGKREENLVVDLT